MDSSHNISSWVGNLVSVGAIVGSMLGWLPLIAAAVGATWYLIQIYESATVQRYLAGRRAQKILHLQAKIAELAAHQMLEDRTGRKDD